MIALVVILAAGGGVPPVGCAGVVDRSSTCASPANEKAPVVADAKPAPPAPAVDPAKLPGELAFLATGLGLGGAAAIAASFAFAPATAEDRRTQTIEQVGGASLLVWAGLVGVSAAALAAFDPASGTFRWKSIYGGGD